MNTLDLVLGIILLLFVIRGFMQGFVISIASLFGLVAGFYGAAHFSGWMAGVLTHQFGMQSKHLMLMAYMLTFVAVIVVVYILGRVLTGLLKTAGLSFLNRLGGGVVGLAKGALLASLLLLFINKADPNGSIVGLQSRQASRLYPQLEKVAPYLIPVLQKAIHPLNPHVSPAQQDTVPA